jgi:ubiquinone/menaquinone biosynthesis C-methylase UbiE
MRIVQLLDKYFYPRYQKNWDDQAFRERILKVISPETNLLDVGAGAGIIDSMNFRGNTQRVCGVDLDPRVLHNPFLDNAHIADASDLPYSDASFDVVIADNVMEHLDQPEQVFREIARVLTPGGRLLFKTPNRRHYMPLIARLTPHRFHQWVNRLRGRHETDTFPTQYLSNSPIQIREIAAKSNLCIDTIELIEGRPEYLRINALTYFLGLLYERLVNLTPLLARYRILLIVTLSKPK